MCFRVVEREEGKLCLRKYEEYMTAQEHLKENFVAFNLKF
jgi:hypothetical protein